MSRNHITKCSVPKWLAYPKRLVCSSDRYPSAWCPSVWHINVLTYQSARYPSDRCLAYPSAHMIMSIHSVSCLQLSRIIMPIHSVSHISNCLAHSSVSHNHAYSSVSHVSHNHAHSFDVPHIQEVWHIQVLGVQVLGVQVLGVQVLGVDVSSMLACLAYPSSRISKCLT